eukprot:jgi/Antlo1/540/155
MSEAIAAHVELGVRHASLIKDQRDVIRIKLRLLLEAL